MSGTLSRGEGKGPAVGIDLGTTLSVIACLDASGRPETLPNNLGDRLTPSAVVCDGGELLVGREAVRASVMAPEKYADCFKRDIGEAYFHRLVCGHRVPPEVLSAFVLRQLKRDAEARLGPIRRVVITVPAFFDEARRRATQEAGRLAGLEVLDIVNEPTAAALAIGHQHGYLAEDGEASGSARERMLVYDLGGGTFDVTVLETDGQEFRALATAGDVQLGGKDFDQRLVEHVAELFRAAHGLDPRSDPQDAAQLWLDAQEVKHALSQRRKAVLTCAYAGLRMKLEIQREQFEETTADLLYRTESTTVQVVREAGLTWSDIDRVLLVGGSTRMPKVAEMLEGLTGKAPDRSASPDEAVAHGAALYAGMLMQSPKASGRLINVNSHSLGVAGIEVATRLRFNCVVIPKNTQLPHRVVKNFVTEREGQRSVRVPIVEGESRRPDECIPLGECVVRNLPPGLPKGTKVQVEFAYAANGRIAVAAQVPSARQSASVTVDRSRQAALEDLETWERRLKQSGDDAFVAEEATGVNDTLANPADALERLDELYTLVGRAVLRMDDLPDTVTLALQSAQEAMGKVAPAQAKMTAAEKARRSASTTSEALHADAAYARAKGEHEQRVSEADFALLVLGRECVAKKVIPEEAWIYLDEIQDLQRRLRNT
ncbi:MAG: Hsp70 family protein [Planctomycetes bacterium]|nr:Hsp70 family protein [Planctomycetota bacterium]